MDVSPHLFALAVTVNGSAASIGRCPADRLEITVQSKAALRGPLLILQSGMVARPALGNITTANDAMFIPAWATVSGTITICTEINK